MGVVAASSESMVVGFVIQGIVYTHQAFISFSLECAINRPWSGAAIITDDNGTMKNVSGTPAFLFISGSQPVSGEVDSMIPIWIDSMTDASKGYTKRSIELVFHMGNESWNDMKTSAFSGNSISRLMDIFNSRKAQAYNRLDKISQPTDVMSWRSCHSTMWDELDSVIGNSYLGGDYIFWAYDEAKSSFFISSFSNELTAPITCIATETPESNASTQQSQGTLENGITRTLKFSYKALRNLIGGDNLNRLFPNIRFYGLVDRDFIGVNMSGKTFAELLSLMGDKKLEELMYINGLKLTNAAYGPIRVIRHWPNNVHGMYEMAPIYRDYRLASFGKVLSVVVLNSFGARLGEKVVILAKGKDPKNSDPYQTDRYLLLGKTLTFNPGRSAIDGDGKPTMVNTSPDFKCTLQLYSDNMVTSDSADVASALSLMGIDGSTV